MIRKLKAYFKSTFVRYMVSYILLVAALVACIMVYMYSYSRKSMYNETVQSETNRLASVRYQCETLMDALEKGAQGLVSSFPGENGEQNALPAALSRLTEGNGNLRAAYALVLSEKSAYSVNGKLSGEELRAGLLVDDEPMETPEFSLNAESETLFGRMLPCRTVEDLILQKSYRASPLLFPVRTDDGRVLGAALFMVSESAFHPMLDDEIASGRNRYILYAGSGYEILVSSDDAAIAERYVGASAKTVEDTETYVMRAGGRDYLCIAMRGDALGFTYFTMISTSSITAAAANGWLGFVAILFVFALPCVAFMIWISRANLKPIQELRSQFSGEGADDISAIRSGIRDLTSRNRDLDSELTRSMPARRIQFVQGLVRGRFSERADAAEAASSLGLNIDKPYYAALLVGAPRDGNTDVYLEKILKSAPDDISLMGTDILAYEQILVLAFADESHRLREFAKSLCALESVRAARVPVAMSDVHDAISAMPTAYLEANSAYENRFVMGDARLLSFKDISFAARSVTPQARGFVDAISQALMNGNGEAANAQLDELLRFLRNTDMSLFAFRQVYNDVISAILSLRDGGKENALQDYDLFTLSNCRSIDELDGILRKICADVINAGSGDEKRPLIQSILAYMTESYADPEFTLASAAEKFGLSTTRLTVEFKENMRMTPSDYLTMLRMEHAKRLLRQSERSIKDICADVGYGDVSSFIRRFKQYAGETPLQYRQNAKEAQESEGGTEAGKQNGI